jgi:hypothetical protein
MQLCAKPGIDAPTESERAMPRFYFDVRQDGVADDPDMDGLDLPSALKARAEAVRAAIDLIRDASPHDSPDVTIAVRSENGEPLFDVQAFVRVRPTLN